MLGYLLIFIADNKELYGLAGTVHHLLSREEAEAVDIIRKATNSLKPEDAVEKILDLFARTRNNREFVENAKRIRFF